MEDSQFDTILYEVEHRIARVTFNRPDVHNAFNDIMIRELIQVFDDILLFSNRGNYKPKSLYYLNSKSCHCSAN